MARNNDEARNALDDFLKNASPEEIKEFRRLLEERKRSRSGGGVNVADLAKTMSRQIQEQMGVTNLNTKKMARDMVVNMARKYKPDITEKELALLVKTMVPSKRPVARVKIPADILKTMVIQFVSYTSGEMGQADRKKLPDGWEKKYWNSFSPEVKNLIAAYLAGTISKKSFWSGIVKASGA